VSNPDKWQREGSANVATPKKAESLLFTILGRQAPLFRASREMFEIALAPALKTLSEVAQCYPVPAKTLVAPTAPGYKKILSNSPAADALLAVELMFRRRKTTLAEVLVEALSSDGPAFTRLKRLGIMRVNVGTNEGYFQILQYAAAPPIGGVGRAVKCRARSISADQQPN
jgi:hypothetical protein